ncbi:hypothetical protein [Streptococcus thoraltensis]
MGRGYSCQSIEMFLEEDDRESATSDTRRAVALDYRNIIGGESTTAMNRECLASLLLLGIVLIKNSRRKRGDLK